MSVTCQKNLTITVNPPSSPTLILSSDKSDIVCGEKFTFSLSSTDPGASGPNADVSGVVTVPMSGSADYFAHIGTVGLLMGSPTGTPGDFPYQATNGFANPSNIVHVSITDPGTFSSTDLANWLNATPGGGGPVSGTFNGDAAFNGAVITGYVDTLDSVLTLQLPTDGFPFLHTILGAWSVNLFSTWGVVYTKQDDSYGIYCPKGLYALTTDRGFFPNPPATINVT